LEVDELITRALSGEASPFEIERLDRWRHESPDNDRYFQEVAQVWALTAPEPVEVSSKPPEVEEIRRAAKDDLPQKTLAKQTARRRWFGWGGAALMAASLTALAFGLDLVGPSGPPTLGSFAAELGETQTVTLSDGSFVRLAEGSRLVELDVSGTREVMLEGKAFFAVARDETRPFLVRTGTGEVRVLGTRFEVAPEPTDEGIRVVVVEGRVELTTERGSVEVPAGSVGWMRGAGAPTSEAVEDARALLDWPEGIMVFHGTPLVEVAEEVSRHYGRALVVSGEPLGARRITAWFQGDPFEETAESLCLVAEAVCRMEGDGVRMDPGIEEGGRR
jgi:transmembrane sensor